MHWLGPEVERLAGSARFTLIYMASIVGGGLMQYYYGHPAAVAFGASGKATAVRQSGSLA